MYSTVARPANTVAAAVTVPASAIQKPAQASFIPLGSCSSVRLTTTYPNAMMKNVVNTSAISTPCAVTER